ncbi:MAG: hypothetical protein IJU40_04065 [Desulfovibrionaceae bacterium]|nr:hypothetical protein [Desulfovibrionaceae bacterium]
MEQTSRFFQKFGGRGSSCFTEHKSYSQDKIRLLNKASSASELSASRLASRKKCAKQLCLWPSHDR